jgi:hypothetical protein
VQGATVERRRRRGEKIKARLVLLLIKERGAVEMESRYFAGRRRRVRASLARGFRCKRWQDGSEDAGRTLGMQELIVGVRNKLAKEIRVRGAGPGAMICFGRGARVCRSPPPPHIPPPLQLPAPPLCHSSVFTRLPVHKRVEIESKDISIKANDRIFKSGMIGRAREIRKREGAKDREESIWKWK